MSKQKTYSGQGTPVTEKNFENLRPIPGTLMLSGDRFFYTIQGEGVTIGRPAIFLRLHFCNLACLWCDTWYTWDRTTQEYYNEPKPYTYAQIVEEISKFPCKRLVVTGGEPLLQKDSIEELIKLIPDWEIEIETNGTQMPTPYLLERCRFNCSPKTTHSGNSRQAMRRPEVLKTLNGLEKSCFKFVFTGREDLAEIEEYIDECDLKPDKIYLMPEGTTRDNIHEHLILAAEVAKEKGWNLTPRLQVSVWGAVRRV